MNNEIDLTEIVMLLKKKWKMIIFITLSFIVAGGTIGFLVSPTYEARTDLLVNNTVNRGDSPGLQTNEIETSLRLIETYNHMLKSDRMKTKVISKLEEPYTKSDLEKRITIESTSNSQIISIIVRERSPEKTAVLANTYAETFKEEIKSLMNLENINVLKEISAKTDIKEKKTLQYGVVFISLMMGIVVAIFVVVFRESHLAKLDTVAKVENSLKIPNLGIVPSIQRKFSIKRSMEEYEGKLISNLQSPLLFTEEFRRVRANVQFLISKKKTNVVLITSSNFGDGKSLVSGNLAVVLAMSGKKTVFVDADLRKSTGRELFDLPERKGLTSIISGFYNLEQVIQQTKTENLSFISSGPVPPNAAEVLSSDEMKRLLESLKERFDVIIIDTPPLIIADTVGLSTIVDGCIYVIDARSTNEEQASNDLEQLKKVEATILGTVLNRTQASTKDLLYADYY